MLEKIRNFQVQQDLQARRSPIGVGFACFVVWVSEYLSGRQVKVPPLFFEGNINQIILPMIKVLIVDDNRFIREALKTLLCHHPQIEIIGECTDGCEVVPFLNDQEVDVIIMDIRMKIMDGLEATKLVHQQFPLVKILGFSCNDEAMFKDKMLRYGATGFLSKFDANINSIYDEIESCYNSTE